MMTNDMMNLRALMEKSPDADFLREMIGYGAQRLMELEVGGLTGAAHGEKSAERLVQRNGCRELPLTLPPKLAVLAATAGATQNAHRTQAEGGEERT
jgi:hypothetical protein